MSRPESDPGPWAAVWLTLAASLTLMLAIVIAGPSPSPGVVAAALGLGLVVGYGGLGTLAARQVPPPADVRLGLRGCAPAFLVPVLLLVPGILLANELNNVAAELFPPPAPALPPEPVAPPLLSVETPLDVLESAVLLVGLSPVLLEWFFRGVLQQGLVAHLGRVGGVGLAALLSAISMGPSMVSFPAWLAGVTGAFLLAAAAGSLRLVSGSLVPAILLQMALGACDVFGRAFADRMPIPGFNAPGAHAPPGLLVGALVSSALGLAVLWRLSSRGREPA